MLDVTVSVPVVLLVMAIGLLIVFIPAIWQVYLAKKRGTVLNLEEFMVGNRSLNFITVMFTIMASWWSGVGFMGSQGWTYTRGASYLYAIVYASLAVIILYTIAPKMWAFGKKYGLMTQGDFIGFRYQSKNLQVLTACLGLVCMIPYVMVQLVAVGTILEVISNQAVPYWLGCLIGILLIVIYTSLGGMRSVAFTDVIQGMILLFSMIVGGIFIVGYFFGGLGELFARVMENDPEHLTLYGGGYSSLLWLGAIIQSGLGGYVWPHMFIRVFGAKSPQTLQRSAIGAGLMNFVVIFFVITGLAAFAVLTPEQVGTYPDANMFRMMILMGSPLLLGIAASGALAAAMSTVDSQLHASSGMVAQDIYYKTINPKAKEETVVKISMISIVVFAIITYFLALLRPASIAEVLLITYGFLVQLFPAIVIGLFWKGANKHGVIWGIVGGLIVSLIFAFLPSILPIVGYSGETFLGLPVALYKSFNGLPSLLVNVVIFWLVSRATASKVDQNYIDEIYADSDGYSQVAK